MGEARERNLLLTISYDGTPFSGWQRQPGRPTVQGEIERALTELCGQPVRIDGTSRTDAGVHALGQRASFHGRFGIPTANLRRALNDRLPGSIRILAVEEKPPGFHARYDCCGKEYHYRLVNGRGRSPFRRHFCWYLERPLDLAAMREAAQRLEGRHDFRCFQAAGGQERESTVRTLYRVRAAAAVPFDSAAGRELRIRTAGDGFLYNMVRILVGTLVEVGLGRRDPAAIDALLASRDRTEAGPTAPARGLYLAEVYYDRARMLRG